MSPDLSIIIPALNEAECIDLSITTLRRQFPAAEVIVVDAGSSDDTMAAAESAGANRVVASPRGRGLQCRVGVEQARGEWLLFLHADTRLLPGTPEALARFCQGGSGSVANFRLSFDEDSWFLRWSAWWTRFDTVFTRFGDQGILIRRTEYDALGGFPAWPLFEDVELLRRARTVRPLPSLVPGVVTSARRFRKQGPFRQQLANGWMLIRFLCGACPFKLAMEYAQGGRTGARTRSPVWEGDARK